MKCLDDELLQRFIDGECSPEEANELELHMSACQDCRHRHAQLQTRVHAIHQAFGMLCRDPLDVPPIPYPEPKKKRMTLYPKYILPLLAAASVLIFILVFSTKENNNTSGDHMSESFFILELDANKPVDQQELSFTVISPSGKVSEEVVR